MKHILRSIFSIYLMLVSLSAFSQEQDTIISPAPKKEAAVAKPLKTQRYGLRIGADISQLARTFYDEDFRGLEIVADYRLTKKIYLAGELGNVDFTVDDDQVNFTTTGSYLKVGFDYNAYENWLDMENMIHIGVRYGFSGFSQNLNSYNIYDSSGYFDEVVVTPGTEYSGLTAHWVEIVGGVKAELFNNLYLGFSVRLNNLISNKKPDNFDNLYIPGFNRTYEGSFGVGFNYTLSYFIPLYKTTK